MSHPNPKPAHKSLVTKRGLAGLGLFATNTIKRGEFIIQYHGPLISDQQADTIGGKYLFALDDGLNIDGRSRNNLARYINHSCRPNCEAVIEDQNLFIYATKKISPAEEITYHYGPEYFESLLESTGCLCDHH